MPTIRIANGIQNHTAAIAPPVSSDAVGTTTDVAGWLRDVGRLRHDGGMPGRWRHRCR